METLFNNKFIVKDVNQLNQNLRGKLFVLADSILQYNTTLEKSEL